MAPETLAALCVPGIPPRTSVERVEDTVRRPWPENDEYVHSLLEHLARFNWPGAPRFRGTDPERREVLEFLPGHVASEVYQPPDVWSDTSLRRIAKLVRQFHDLTAGTALAGEFEVVCHNDLSPRNTVYQETPAGLEPYAFIDWDKASGGWRVHDIAHVCWQFLDLGPWRSSPVGPGRLMRVICDGYDLSSADRAVLVETVLWWQEQCWRGIERGAESGDPAQTRLVEIGAVSLVKDAHAWVTENADILDTMVTQ